MPQMSPMYWTLILMMMTMTIIQMNSLNFFESKFNKQKKKKLLKKSKNWKW